MFRKQQTHIMPNKIRYISLEINIHILFFDHLKTYKANIKAKAMTSKCTAEFGNNNKKRKFLTMKLYCLIALSLIAAKEVAFSVN